MYYQNIQAKIERNLNEVKFGLKTSFEKEKTMVHTTKRCKVCVFR